MALEIIGDLLRLIVLGGLGVAGIIAILVFNNLTVGQLQL